MTPQTPSDERVQAPDPESKPDPNRKAIFDAVLQHVLTDADFKDSRDFYGTPDDNRFALVSSSHCGVPWPEWYTPSVQNFESTRVVEGSANAPDQPRLLGIRLDEFNLSEDQKGNEIRFLDGGIQITLLNAGGNAGGSIHTGGCMVYYDAKRDDGEWTVVCNGALDP